ncbi:MAG: hypothetical protein H6832_11260 [Planctomycetes bacterium]|nr:hypothetical protein [Planctomycetota bacterium]MCB9918968.1 hypothetical protein [Planctomycetota bacterium]
MRTLLPTALAFALSAGQVVVAQDTVPDGFLNITGSGSTAYPLGSASPMRIQYLYDESEFAKPVVSIRELAIRAQENGTYGAKTGIELEIRLSSSRYDIFNASTTFASNRGANEVVAFTKKMINTPAFTAMNPQPFAIVFKLDTAFVYTRLSGNLLIEYVMTQAVSGSLSQDTEFSRSAVVTAVGTPCVTASQSVSGGTSTSASSTLTFSLTGGPISGVAAHVLGFQKLATPVPLPFGNCPLYINPLLVFGVVTNASGSASMTYPIPLGTRTTAGPVVYGQWVGITATSWNSTQAHEVVLGGYLPHGRIYDLTGTTSPTGSVQVGSGIVHRIQ